MRHAAALAGVLVVALAVAACGTSSLSADQLRSAASRTCDLARRRTDRIPTPSTPSGGIRFLSRGIAALEPEQATLANLRAPGDLAGYYRTAVEASGRQLAALRFALSDLRAGNDAVAAIRSLQRKLSPLESRGDAAWHSLGIPACRVR